MDDEILFLHDEDFEKRNEVLEQLAKELGKKHSKQYKESVLLKNLLKSAIRQSNIRSENTKESKKEIVQVSVIRKSVDAVPYSPHMEKPSAGYKIDEYKAFRVLPKPRYIQKVETSKKIDGINLGIGEIQTLQRHDVPLDQSKLNISHINDIKEDHVYRIREGNLDLMSKRVLDNLEIVIGTEQDLKNFNQYFKKITSKLGVKRNSVDKDNVKRILVKKLIGFGRLDDLIQDTNIREIHVNGLHIPVIVKLNEYGYIRTNLIFNDNSELIKIIVNISKSIGININDEKPDVDGNLQSGAKVSAHLGAHYSNPRMSIIK